MSSSRSWAPAIRNKDWSVFASPSNVVKLSDAIGVAAKMEALKIFTLMRPQQDLAGVEAITRGEAQPGQAGSEPESRAQ